MNRFQYHRPDNWQQAMQLLAEPDAVAKMGGCDVMTRFRMGKLKSRSVVALNDLPGVTDIAHSSDGVLIGAAATFQQIERDSKMRSGWPIIADTLATIGSPAIRGAATIAGNIAQGWSVSDVVPLFAVYGAELRISGLSGQRSLPVSDYIQMHDAKPLKPGEIIAAVFLPVCAPDFRVAYERFCFREAFDLPLASVAVGACVRSGSLSDVRVAVVGGSTMPARCKPVEATIEGKPNDERTRKAASSAIAAWANPVSDFRASADYRRHIVGVMLERALAKLQLP